MEHITPNTETEETTVHPQTPAEPEVKAEAKTEAKKPHRQFSDDYKAKIVAEANKCKKRSGGITKIVEREKITYSQLAAWRDKCEKKAPKKAVKKRGNGNGKRIIKGTIGASAEQRLATNFYQKEAEYQTEIERLTSKLEQLQTLLKVQQTVLDS